MQDAPKDPDPAAEFQAQLAALRADLAALTATLAALSRSGAEQVRQTAAEAMADLRAKGGDPAEAATRHAEQTLEGIAEYARKNPLQSLGMAAGLGVMLGLLVGRR